MGQPYLQTRGQQRPPTLVLKPIHAEQLMLLAERDEAFEGGQRILRGHLGPQAAYTQLGQ
jgi:hypothetical protein